MNPRALFTASLLALLGAHSSLAAAQARSRRARLPPPLATATPNCPARSAADTASLEGSFYLRSGARLPAQIVAIRQDAPAGCAYFVTVPVDDRFALRGLPAGSYVLVAYARDAAGRERAGGYTDSVTCMATCGHRGDCCRGARHVSHVITLRAGERARHIHIADWEASLPPRPAGVL